MGHCGMQVKSAHKSDEGTWNCYVGTTESRDIKEKIQVSVYGNINGNIIYKN